jgi:uncharacterized protein involved in outer membrane biogenesis
VAIAANTDWGRRRLADGLEKLVSDNIPGKMLIGRLERVGMLKLLIRDLEFIHPNGTTVLHLDEADVDVDAAAMLRGRLAFHRAAVSGGQILFEPEPDGRVSLEAAVDSKTPGSGNPEDGFHYDMRSIHVQNLNVVLRLAKEEVLRLRNTRGFVAIWRETTPGVRVRLEAIEGRLDRELLGADVKLVQADGLIRGKDKRLMDLQLQLLVADKALSGQLTVFDRQQPPAAELTLHTDGSVETSLVAMGLKLGSWFTDAVRVKWE